VGGEDDVYNDIGISAAELENELAQVRSRKLEVIAKIKVHRPMTSFSKLLPVATRQLGTLINATITPLIDLFS
jgi:hypothetical protein